MKSGVIFFLMIFFNSSMVLGADWFVDNAATGSNNGSSWQDAWKGFGDINWSVIQPGDIIYISGGQTSKIYTVSSDSKYILAIKKSGKPGAPITIKPGAAHPTLSSGHDGLVILDGQWKVEFGIYIRNKQYVTIDGGYNGTRKIEITRTNNIGVHVYAGVAGENSTGDKILWLYVNRVGNKGNAHGMTIYNGWRAEIAHNVISDAYQDGLKVLGCTNATDYGQGPDIHDNVIQNISDDGVAGDGAAMDFHDNIIGQWRDVLGAGHPDGMQIYDPTYSRIYNNTFYDSGNPNNSSNAFIFIDVATAVPIHLSHVKIFNNTFYVAGKRYRTNWWAIFIYGENAIRINDILIANNTFIDIPWNAIYIKKRESDNCAFSDLKIVNNLIVNAYNKNDSGHGAPIWLGHGQDYSNIVIDNNIIYPGIFGGQTIYYDGIPYATVQAFDADKGTTNYTCKPSFVSYIPGSADTGDFHLSLTDSCARDKGTNLSAYFSNDKDGISRPQSGPWDIGAYEMPSKSNYLTPPANLKIP